MSDDEKTGGAPAPSPEHQRRAKKAIEKTGIPAEFVKQAASQPEDEQLMKKAIRDIKKRRGDS